MLEKKLHEELNRFRAINRYAKKMIIEQDAPPAPAPDAAMPPAPAPDAGMPPAPALDAGMPPAGAPAPAPAPAPSETEEIDVTDLVNMTKNIKKDIDKNKAEHGDVLSKMDGVFSKLSDLENKIKQMDVMLAKIDELGNKMENMKEPTPVEKLEMRSLDSYPFSQNPQQFFQEKQGQMRASGKNEYVLTKDDIENYAKEEIRTTFNPEQKDELSL